MSRHYLRNTRRAGLTAAGLIVPFGAQICAALPENSEQARPTSIDFLSPPVRSTPSRLAGMLACRFPLPSFLKPLRSGIRESLSNPTRQSLPLSPVAFRYDRILGTSLDLIVRDGP